MKPLALLLLASLAITAVAQRDSRGPGGPAGNILVGRDNVRFLAPNPLDLPALLPPPPAPGSPTERVELDQILELQKSRTPEQAARCVQIENETIWLFGSEVLGPWFTEASLPKTAAFFATVRQDFIAANRDAKAVHPRKRPPFADERIKPCVEFADTPSYPSGHGIQSSVWAGLLGAIFPDKADEFILRAATTRNYKAISGVHFPSDLAAGQAVGEALARELLKNPAVQKAIVEVRAEAAAARKASTASTPPARPERPRLSAVHLKPPANSKAGRNLGLAGMDARWADHGEYLQALVERVQTQWYAILKDTRETPPRGASVVVTFRLDAQGASEMVKVEDNGAGKAGVFACQNAITYPGAFPKWSNAMIKALGESQILTFSFHYQ